MHSPAYPELASTRWYHRRDEYLRDHPYCTVCQFCNPLATRADGRPVIQVHHLTYERAGGDEIDEDLVTLCSSCHTNLHAAYRDAIYMALGEGLPREDWERGLAHFSRRWIIREFRRVNPHHFAHRAEYVPTERAN